MKKLFFLFALVFCALTIYAQDYQFIVTDEFELKEKGLLNLAFHDNELYLYDSTESKIYRADAKGLLLDSLHLNWKANGMDLYKDTLFVQAHFQLGKKSTIFKINRQNGAVYDSINWSMVGDYARQLAVGSKYMISWVYAGWSSSIVLIDRAGTVLHSIFSPGLANEGDFSFISSNKFCLIRNQGINKNGLYYEYEINNSKIVPIYASEIPVKDPQGIAFVTDSTFYVYSGSEGKIVQLTKRGTVAKLDELDGIKNIQIYPNPTRNYFRIESALEIDKIELLNSLGQKMNFQRMNDLIRFQHYPKGVYFVIIATEQNITTKKLIIK